MAAGHRKYTEEFKREAVRLIDVHQTFFANEVR